MERINEGLYNYLIADGMNDNDEDPFVWVDDETQTNEISETEDADLSEDLLEGLLGAVDWDALWDEDDETEPEDTNALVLDPETLEEPIASDDLDESWIMPPDILDELLTHEDHEEE